MPKKQVSQDRKARIAELQKQEKARENRVRVQIIAGCTVLLLVLGGLIAYAVADAAKQQPDVAITAIGVPASEASCDAPTTDKAGGSVTLADGFSDSFILWTLRQCFHCHVQGIAIV